VEVTTATAIVDYTVTSSDAVDGPVVAACAPGSGSAFPVGTNVVECAAADAAGNQTLARFTVTVRTPPNISSTPVGSNVLAEPEATLPDGSTRDVTVSFDSVTASGLTTVTTSSSGPPPPSGFKLGTPPIYYELSTTSTFQGVATVCFSWQEGEIQNEARTRLLHYENGGWQDVTTSVDVNANVVCGRVTSFSPFAVVETAYRFSGFLSPLVTGRSVVLQAKQTRTVPVKFQLLFQDQPTGEPGAQIALYALDPAGNIVGGNLAVDAGSANGGATAFRYDSQSQHYIFNLSTKNLAVGSYRVIVTIDDGTTAKADLVLK
jgi:hypothetical protein